ncbi:MAG: CCA tRNA nucleotidyltransferase [Akkermansiaceae bacterium]|nr:CCA tRNA nucleotidyltransferase [Akkermansiaceae bacterium]
MIQIPEHALTVVERLERYGYEAYVVGGCVRDSLLGRGPKDWDVCTNALPEEVLRVFRRFHVIKTGLQHGTVTVMVSHQPVEVTTFRIDGAYTDNRHPDSVNFVSRVEEDLARRDFTINAMAYNPTRGLVDAFGGQEDLRAGIIRCVGEPDARFNEDGLRILRALRFAARYNFGIETETAFSIHRNRHLLENVSVERIFAELKGILVGEGVLGMMQAFPDVFAIIIPELAPTIGFDQHNPHHCYDVWTHIAHAVQAAPADEVLRLALLLHDIAKPATYTLGEDGKGHFYDHGQVGADMARDILLHLKSDTATLQNVVTLVREHDRVLPTTAPGMRRIIGKLGISTLQQLLAVKQADMSAQSSHEREQKKATLRDARLLLEEMLDEPPAFTVGDLAITGRDLIALGVKPGPALGHILKTLLSEVQDELLDNTRDALSTRARELL